MKKKTTFTAKDYQFLLTGLQAELTKTPKLKPNRETWDIEGTWQDCGDILFVESRYMAQFALWRDFGCKTIKLINYGRAAVKMSFYSKHKYWLKKPQDMTDDERDDYITEHVNTLLQVVMQLRTKIDQQPPLAQAETRSRIEALSGELDAWQLIRSRSQAYELAVSTYQRGYAYLYVSYKFLLPTGEYENASEHLLHHTRDRIGNITQTKQNVLFVDMNEINRVHPQQNKEIEAYLGRFAHKSASGAVRLYARLRPETESQESFGQYSPDGDPAQLDLFEGNP
jgi:hypothetical protein